MYMHAHTHTHTPEVVKMLAIREKLLARVNWTDSHRTKKLVFGAEFRFSEALSASLLGVSTNSFMLPGRHMLLIKDEAPKERLCSHCHGLVCCAQNGSSKNGSAGYVWHLRYLVLPPQPCRDCLTLPLVLS